MRNFELLKACLSGLVEAVHHERNHFNTNTQKLNCHENHKHLRSSVHHKNQQG